jgi:hypothetical protein
MAGSDPVFSEQGDRIEAALEARLHAAGPLNRDEIDSVVEVVAASYQKALQLRFVVESLVGGPEGPPGPSGRAALADGLESVEELLNGLTTLHATTRDKLYYAAQRIHLGREWGRGARLLPGPTPEENGTAARASSLAPRTWRGPG